MITTVQGAQKALRSNGWVKMDDGRWESPYTGILYKFEMALKIEELKVDIKTAHWLLGYKKRIKT